MPNPDLEANRRKNGEFGNKPMTDGDDIARVETLSAAAVANLETLAREASNIQRAAERTFKVASVGLLTHSLRTAFPTGARADFFQDWNDSSDGYKLAHVYDTDQNLIFDHEKDEVPTGVWLHLLQVQDGLNEYTTYESTDLEDHGNVCTIHLNAPIVVPPSSAGDIIGINRLSPNIQAGLLRDAGSELGAVIPCIDKSEVEYRLDNPADYGLAADAFANLEAKYGDRQAALSAVIDTDAWTRMDEYVAEQANDAAGEGIANAVAEALAAE